MAQAGEEIARVEPPEHPANAGGVQPHVKTHGEHKFDRITYNGIGYLLNAVISVASVYWVERMHSGQRFMTGLVKQVSKLGAHPDTAKFLATKSFFLSGGFAVLAPMKWLEDAKVGLVEKWDRRYYGDKVDTDPALQQSHRELEDAPKQTWRSVFSARALALVPFYLTIGLLWSRTSLISRWTNPELRQIGKDAVVKALAENPSLGFWQKARIPGKAFTAFEAEHPKSFAHIADKGWYVDKLVTGFGRSIGKSVASRGEYYAVAHEGEKWSERALRHPLRWIGKATVGVPANPQAVQEIEAMQKAYPGTLWEGRPARPSRDPDHSAIPYYIGSEAITCAVVAAGVYVLTRLTGPFFGRSREKKRELREERRNEEFHRHQKLPVTASSDETPPPAAKDDKPSTKIDVAVIEHQKTAVATPSAARAT